MASHQPHTLSQSQLHAAMANTAELRALHAALLQSHLHTAGSNAGSPAVLRFGAAAASPSLLRASSQATDYPVFTPSYEENPLTGYQNLFSENRIIPQTLRIEQDESANKHHSTTISEQSLGSAVEHFSNQNVSVNRPFFNQPTPTATTSKSFSKRTGSEAKSISAFNPCTPIDRKKTKNTNTEACEYQNQNIDPQEKHKGAILSWLFPKSRKKSKPALSHTNAESENTSQILKGWGVLSIESLKKELHDANRSRDAALAEVSEMKTSLTELQHKLISLETHCEELKKALKTNAKSSDRNSMLKRFKYSNGGKDNPMPVSNEAMVEGFLQIVSEARTSMKQFCKSLIHHVAESGDEITEKLNLLLQPYQIRLGDKISRGLLYHLEALVNRSLYEDFENCVFQRNGCAKCLDPLRNRHENFSAFVELRNLSWNDVLQKGTKFHSEEFSKFCDRKMSCIVSMLSWSRPWPEELLQGFFVAAKCVWLLHLLSFSFEPPLAIMCVDEGHDFDPLYMDNVVADSRSVEPPQRVKVMVMPGFYVEDRVLRCRVICSNVGGNKL